MQGIKHARKTEVIEQRLLVGYSHLATMKHDMFVSSSALTLEFSATSLMRLTSPLNATGNDDIPIDSSPFTNWISGLLDLNTAGGRF